LYNDILQYANVPVSLTAPLFFDQQEIKKAYEKSSKPTLIFMYDIVNLAELYTFMNGIPSSNYFIADSLSGFA
jgi:hypothetical protein